MSHYYDASPNVSSDEQLIERKIATHQMKFHTDNGVFSKASIDYGSEFLIEQFINQVNCDESTHIVDVGCGYGPIGLTVKKHFNCQMTMVDINERSIQLAKKNAKLNNLRSSINIFQNDILSNIGKGEIDILLTNPPIRAGKEVVHSIITQARQLDINEVWVVIQKKQGMSSMKKHIESLYSDVETIAKSKGYYILRGSIDLIQ